MLIKNGLRPLNGFVGFPWLDVIKIHCRDECKSVNLQCAHVWICLNVSSNLPYFRDFMLNDVIPCSPLRRGDIKKSLRKRRKAGARPRLHYVHYGNTRGNFDPSDY